MLWIDSLQIKNLINTYTKRDEVITESQQKSKSPGT